MVPDPGRSRGYPGLRFSSPCEFPKCSCWGMLVGATPLHLLSQTALPLKSPTGAFIASLRFANAVPPQTLPGTSTANWNLSIILQRLHYLKNDSIRISGIKSSTLSKSICSKVEILRLRQALHMIFDKGFVDRINVIRVKAYF